MESAQLSAGAPLPEIEIRPPRRWGDLRLGELLEFKELIYFLFKRELQVRYKQSALGVAWAVLQPIALTALFALFFGHLASLAPVPGIPYVVYALSGLVPWLFNSQAVALSATSLVADASLLSKVYFPRLAIPIAKVSALLLDLSISLTVLVIVTMLYGVSISATIVLVPLFLLLAVITAFGTGVLLAAVNVKYRDVGVATPLLLQMWLFASPIIYQTSLIPGDWKYVYALNPMVSVLDGVRWSIYGVPAPNLGMIAISIASALTIFTVGLVYFRRTEQFFADIV